ncbi:MAG TPA: ABC transporter substrate-binding protein [bacterium]|nr:ABC transporter substrate-binding protein [bacterium]
MRRFPGIVAVLAIILGALVIPVAAQEMTKVRVGDIGIGGTSDHLRVAVGAGIFRKYGFDVENLLIESSSVVVQSLIAGDLSFVQIGAAPVVAAVANGAELKIIAVPMNRFNFAMVSAPEIKTPQDLKGKILAISRIGSGDEFVTRETLRWWNLNPEKDVRLLQVGFTPARLAALKSGQVHATLLSPLGAVEAKKIGLNVLADLTEMDIEYAHTALVTRSALIAEKRSFVERFLQAFVEGVKYFRSHPEEGIAYLRKFSKLPEDQLKAVYESIRKSMREEPVPTLGGIQTVIRGLRGEKDRTLDPNRVIDLSFFKGAVSK